jgi:CBS domain-containing protein
MLLTQMRVGEAMTRDVACCSPNQSLLDAVRIMHEKDCGCVPVVDEERQVVGVVTDRDACLAELRLGRSFRELTVSEAMSSPAVTCRAEENADAAQRLMRRHQVRRLPVVDDRGRLIGLLSLSDVILEAARQSHFRFRNVFATETAHTLAAISLPDGAEEERRAVLEEEQSPAH